MELCPDQFGLKWGGLYMLWCSKFGREFFAQFLEGQMRFDGQINWKEVFKV